MSKKVAVFAVLGVLVWTQAFAQEPVRVVFEAPPDGQYHLAASIAHMEAELPVRFTSFFDLSAGENWRHVFERLEPAAAEAYRSEQRAQLAEALKPGHSHAVVIVGDPVSPERDAALLEFVRGGGMILWIGVPPKPDAQRELHSLLPMDIGAGGVPRMPTEGTNLLTNGDFENGIEGWAPHGDAKVVQPGAAAKGSCLELSNGAWYEAAGPNLLEVREGDQFVFSFDWRQMVPQWGPNLHTGLEPSYPNAGEYPRGVNYDFSYFGIGGTGIRMENGRDPVFFLYTHETDWHTVRTLVTVQAGSGLKKLRLWQSAKWGAGAAYQIDNVRLDRIKPGAQLPAPPKAVGNLVRVDKQLLAGVPLEVLPVAPFAPFTPGIRQDDRVLLKSELGFPLAVLRPVGKGRVLFFPMSTDGIFFPRCDISVWERVDSDALWTAFWGRIFGLLRETKVPTAEVALAAPTFAPGQGVQGKVSLRNWTGKARFELCDRSGRAVATAALKAKVDGDYLLPALTLDPGLASGQYVLRVLPADSPMPAGCAVVTVKSPLALTIVKEPAKDGWRVGEAVRFVCKVTSELAEPQQTPVRLALWDYQGRAVHYAAQRVAIPAKGEATVTFDWQMPDLGTAGWFFWATAECAIPGRGSAWACTNVDRAKKYSFREELQWSAWTALEGRFPRAAIPSVLRLYEDARYNALGQGSYDADQFWARRSGVRQYTEIPHFGGIDNIGWPEDSVEEFLRKVAPGTWPRVLRNSVVAVASYGEEPGYGPAFGTTWHWDDGPAPEGATRHFRKYLRQLYGDDIKKLNGQWETNFESFDKIQLEKQYSLPGKHWESLPEGQKLPENLSRHVDTHAFYHWYFIRFNQALRDIMDELNPTSVAVMSMDNNFMTQLDTVGMYNHWLYPKEWPACYYAYQRQFARDPAGFIMNWGFFEDNRVNAQLYLLSLMQGATVFSFWYDFPLQFNPDLTHTRASLWFRALRESMDGKEAALLLTKPYVEKEVGIYIPLLDWKACMGRPAWMMGCRDLGGSPPWAAGYGGYELPFYSALCESGYAPRFIGPAQIAESKVIFMPYCESVPPSDALALRQFVERGGTLVASPKLATRDVHGRLLDVAPGEGFSELFGLTAREKLRNAYGFFRPDEKSALAFGEGYLPGGEPYTLQSFGHQEITSVAPDTQVLARHADGQPAIILRKVGQGTAIYLNFSYFWSEGWYTFFSQSRESFRVFIQRVLAIAGIGPSGYFLETANDDGSYAETSWAAYPYEGMSGGAKFLRLYADWRRPELNANLVLRWPVKRVWDVLRGEELPIKSVGNRRFVPLHMKPAEGRILSLVEEPARKLELSVSPRSPKRGDTAKLTLRIVAESGQLVGARRPVTVETRDAVGRRIAMLCNHVEVKGEAVVTLPIALNESERLTVTATDVVEGLRAELPIVTGASGTLNAADLPRAAPDYRPQHGLPLADASDAEFLSLLRQLRRLYCSPDSGRRELLAHLYCHPTGRHAALERLWRIKWPDHVPALHGALAAGEVLVLLPEDLGVSSPDGRRVYPNFDGLEVEALQTLARSRGVTALCHPALPDYLVLSVGKGALVVSRTSPDGVGWSDMDVQRWHRESVQALEALGLQPQGTFKPSGRLVPLPGGLNVRDWLRARAQ